MSLPAAAGCPRPPSVSGWFWWLTVLVGCPLFGWATMRIVATPGLGLVPALVTLVLITVVVELLPLILGRHRYAPHVALSTAFVYALIFVWGAWPAVITQAGAAVCYDVRAGKPWYKVLFNVGQNSITVVCTAGVAELARGSASLAHPATTFHAVYLPLLAVSWLVCIGVNLGLVSGVMVGLGAHWLNSPRDFAREIYLSVGVLAMSPLIVVIAVDSWYLSPLLLTPLLLISHTGRIAAASEHDAGHDSLTGLPNRSTLSLELDDALATHERNGRPFALMLVDLNDFKGVNDTLGHQAGDSLLAQFADRLRSAVRPGDCVARLGGDEFAVLALDVDADGARVVAARIRHQAACSFTVDTTELDVDFSLGIALCPDHGRDATSLLRRADLAMYRAKAARSGVEVFDSDLQLPAAS